MESINIIKFEGEMLREKDIENLLYKRNNPFYKKLLGREKKIHIEQIKYTYKPYWFIKVLALETRPPFKPKRAVYVSFVDAVTGFAGLTYEFPQYKNGVIENKEEIYINEERMLKIVDKVKEKQIFRKYFLKRPEIRLEKYKLIYLPYALVKISRDVEKANQEKILYVNLISGEIDS